MGPDWCRVPLPTHPVPSSVGDRSTVAEHCLASATDPRSPNTVRRLGGPPPTTSTADGIPWPVSFPARSATRRRARTLEPVDGRPGSVPEAAGLDRPLNHTVGFPNDVPGGRPSIARPARKALATDHRPTEGVATLYDSLLDELEDDVVSNPQDVEDLTVKVVDAEEADADKIGRAHV